MDIWMVSCITFVFLALCEFVIVKYLQTKMLETEKKEKELKNRNSVSQEDSLVSLILQMKRKFGKDAENKNAHPYIEFYRRMENDNNPDKNKMMKENYKISLVIQDNTIQQIVGAESNPFLISSSPSPMFGTMPIQPSYKITAMNGMMDPRVDGGPNFFGTEGQQGQDKARPLWVQIDRTSRIIFPAMFLVFNLVFWPVLLVASQK